VVERLELLHDEGDLPVVHLAQALEHEAEPVEAVYGPAAAPHLLQECLVQPLPGDGAGDYLAAAELQG